jgi:predicted neuraminidase
MLTKRVVSTRGARLWQGIPGIERAANGRLWVIFFSGGPKEPHEENNILLTTSEDGGESWETPQVVIDPPGATRAFDPALWHDPSGRLWLFYNQANLLTDEHSVWAMNALEAHTDSPKWSAPQLIDLNVPFAFRLNKPTVTQSGSWLLPVTFARSAPGQWLHPDRLQGVAISKDQGQTWNLCGDVEAHPRASETMTFQRADGSLAMWIRTASGVIWQSFSQDDGETWSPGEPTSIANPGSRFFVRRLHSGRLLLINTPHPKERTTLYACLSADDGETFGEGLQLDDRTMVSYPDAVQTPDGLIQAVYDHDRYGVGEIMFCSFTEQDILQVGVRARTG